MRRSPFVLLATSAFVGCAAAPAPSAPRSTTIPTIASAEAASSSAAASSDPANLVNVTAPPSLCTLRNPSGNYDLAARAAGDGFLRVPGRETTITLGLDGVLFGVTTTSEWTARGFVSVAGEPQEGFSVYPAKWLVFGGVFFSPIESPLEVHGVSDGKIEVAAPADGHFQIANEKAMLMVSCDDVALTPDPDGILQRDVPDAFPKSGKPVRFLGNSRVPVYAEPGQPPVGDLALASTDPIFLLDVRGKMARIRFDHIVGWIDLAALSMRPPSLSPLDVVRRYEQHLDLPRLVHSERRTPQPSATSGWRCPRDVRLIGIATMDPGELFALGKIPAGGVVRVISRDHGLADISLDDGSPDTPVPVWPARIVALETDLASCTEEALSPASTSSAFAPTKKAAQRFVRHDAIDALVPGIDPVVLSAFSRVTMQDGDVKVGSGLDPNVVHRIVRQNFGDIRQCYEMGLLAEPTLEGSVVAKFAIGSKGEVTRFVDTGTASSRDPVKTCVAHAFQRMTFPPPASGKVSVEYPIALSLRAP